MRLLNLLLQPKLLVSLSAKGITSDETHVLVYLQKLRLQRVSDEELVVANTADLSFLAGLRGEPSFLVKALAAEGQRTELAVLWLLA